MTYQRCCGDAPCDARTCKSYRATIVREAAAGGYQLDEHGLTPEQFADAARWHGLGLYRFARELRWTDGFAEVAFAPVRGVA